MAHFERLLAAGVLLVAMAQVGAGGNLVGFTYQGRLAADGAPATGAYDFEIRIFDSPTGGVEVGVTTALEVPVTNGVFMLQLSTPDDLLDMNPWLEISVRAVTERDFTVLAPRQELRSMLPAVHAFSVGDGPIDAADIRDGSVGTTVVDGTRVEMRVNRASTAGSAIAPPGDALGSVLIPRAPDNATRTHPGHPMHMGPLVVVLTR